MGDAILTYSTITERYEPKDGNTPLYKIFLQRSTLSPTIPVLMKLRDERKRNRLPLRKNISAGAS